jgi:hypothetical protein
MKMKSYLSIGLLLRSSLIGFVMLHATTSRADDFDKCLQGLAAYNSVIDAFVPANKGCADSSGSDEAFCGPWRKICDKTNPAVYYASCEKFISTGSSSEPQQKQAADASAKLKWFYDQCQAQ